MNVQEEIGRVTRYGQQLETLLDGKVLKPATQSRDPKFGRSRARSR